MTKRAEIYLALVHYPVLNRQGDKICSAITNLDIHDIARTCTTFGVEGFFIVTPSQEQKALAQRVMKHWLTGAGGRFNPDRKRAFEQVTIVDSVAEAIELIGHPRDQIGMFATSARKIDECISWERFEKIVYKPEFECILLLFGTASGLHEECLHECDGVICPIYGPTDYNHLSVRSAVAITLDRITGIRRQ
ncbi:MAG: RNA methyltransferase [Thermodesulfobacteria bacterium]|nr:RNA methyltransferase [Thermodesulfobacteriota bacterium]